MAKKHLPHSARKHIRKEKARIRTRFSDAQEVAKKIRELVETIRHGYTEKGNQ